MPNGDTPQVKPWSEIAKNFDPMMPADTYNNLRLQYFHNFVAPKVKKGSNVDATWAEFKNLTERQSLAGAGGKAQIHLNLGMTAALENMVAPLKDLHPDFRKVHDALVARDLELTRLGEREGLNTGASRAVGAFMGQAVDFALLTEVLGPAAGGLAATMAENAKVAELLTRTFKGGIAFGTYDALSADKGNRLMAGMKGFAVGASFDLALGMPGYLRGRGLASSTEEAEKLVEGANAGKPANEAVDTAIAQKVQHDAEVSRKELRPEKEFWAYTRQSRGARVRARTLNGEEVLVELKGGKEHAAYQELRDIVDRGGSVVNFEVHPDETASLNEFVRIMSRAEEGKYRSTLLRTSAGKAEEVAKIAKAEGVPATAVSGDHVELGTVPVEHPILNKPQERFVRKGREVVSVIPERKPSPSELDLALSKRKDLSIKDRMFLERQFERVWDPDVEYEDKRKSIVMLSSKVPEMLPERYRANLPPMDAKGNLIREVAEARVYDTAEKVLGYRPNFEPIRKVDGKAMVEFTTQMTPEEVGKLQEALGNEFEARVIPKGRPRSMEAKLLSEEEIDDLATQWGVTREDFDVEAVREGGEVELQRQLATKKPELYGKPTRPPVQPSLADKVPMSEQRIYTPVQGGVKAGEQTYNLLQSAVDDSGVQKFMGAPAGGKDVITQVKEATLNGRLMGSIEDVPQQHVVPAMSALRAKGWMVIPLRGYKPREWEIVYFHPKDIERVAPMVEDFDNYISKQAGRAFNTDGRPIMEVGDAAHARLGKAFGVPEGEISQFAKERQVQGNRMAPEVVHKPYGDRLSLQFDDLQKLFPGAAALATPDLEAFAKSIGLELPPSLKGGENLVILTPQSDRQLVFHERLHANSMHAGVYGQLGELITGDHRRTALELATGIAKDFPGYNKLNQLGKLEEAYTHAATAVRFGDKPYLEQLARHDRSVDHVIDFVFDTSNNLLERSFRRPESVPVRIYQRTLWDLMRRSSRQVSESLREGVRATGSGLSSWYDTASDEWVVGGLKTGERRFKDINDLWDHLLANDKNFIAPSMSLRPELGGVRGPITPIGRAPDGAPLPLPERSPEGKYIGMSAASALWRPFFPWLSTLHESMNAMWRKSGKYLPLYESAKAVDDQFRLGDKWLNDNYEEVADLLKPFGGKKMHSVFDYLTYPESERTSKLMEKYQLTPEEGQRAHLVWQWMKDFRDDTQINIPQYMLEYHPKLRGFNWAPERVFGPMGSPQVASLWDKVIRHEGRWDPQDAHLGRFLHVMLREGMEKKFTGKALNELDKLVSRKTAEGTYVIPNAVRWPVDNYVRYMRGIPDTSQQVINKTMTEMFSRMNAKIVELNKSLPAGSKLPEFTAPPRQALQRFMLMSYAMGLGLRPAIAIRDMFQAFTGGLTVMGPVRFTKAFTEFMTHPSRAIALADEAGALLRKNNIGELYGDITQEVPLAGSGWMDRVAKWSNTLLAPSRWGHNFGRAITYYGEYTDTLEAIKAYRRGSITGDQLVEQSSMWFMDRPAQGNLLRYITDMGVPAEDAAKKVALEAVDLTQWPYRRGTQPSLLTYGAGRIFGQYGVWPANYADFLYRMGKKWTERPQLAARTTATWVAVQYALTHAMEAAGADTSKWFWQSPAGFAGSPHWDFVHAAMLAPENTQEGHAARKTILEYPLNFVPALSEMRSVAQAIENDNGDFTQENILRALGFKPIDQVQQDQAWQDLLKTQLGFENARRR